jgi:uncharacterized phage protein gp47/JayE
MPLNRPNLGQLVNQAESEINALVPGADARLPYSVLGVFARVWGALTDGLYSALNYLVRQCFVRTADYDFLVQHADTYGLTPLPAKAAQGCITLQGAGAVVPAGSIFSRLDGTQYQTSNAATVPLSGFIDVPCICLSVGSIGNALAGTILTSSVSIALLVGSQVCTSAISGGAEAESAEQLRSRVLQRIQNPPGAGTASDWERWARQLSSAVTRVWVVPAVSGNGTVGIVFAVDNNGIVPSPSLVAQMTTHLAKFNPAGCVYTVYAPTLKPVAFSITAMPSGSVAVRSAISEELQDLLFREARPGSVIPLSRVSEAISSAQGETDHILVAPIAPPSFAASPTFEIGVLGAITWI